MLTSRANSLFAVLAIGGLGLLGCESTAAQAPVGEPKLSWIQTNVFAKSCVNSACHGNGASPAGQLSLSDTATSFAALVNAGSSQQWDTGKQMVRVVPGKAAESLLNLAVTTGYKAVKQMPLGAPLDAYKQEAIRAWIAGGALNN